MFGLPDVGTRKANGSAANVFKPLGVDDDITARLRLLSRILASVVFLIGVSVIFGWMFDIALLKSILPIWVSMKANTAACFVIIGVSMWSHFYTDVQQASSRLSKNDVRRHLAYIGGAIVALTGLLTLGEYLFGWDLGIDQLLFKEPIGAVLTSHPGRMAPNTAVNFSLIGLSLLLVNVETGGGHRPAQYLILGEGVITLLSLIGYFYGVSAMKGFSAHFTPMAAHTAVAFTLACVGILCLRPDRGIMSLVASSCEGGMIARRLLLVAIGIPFVIGWLCLAGNRMGLYDTDFRAALTTVLSIVVLLLFIWYAARALDQTAVQRNRLQRERDQKAADLEAANKELEAFSYSVSHDLRAPLRSIDGFSRILLEDYERVVDEEGKDMLRRVRAATQRMGQLIDDMLKLSRVNRAEIRSAQVDISALAKVVAERLRKSDPARNASFDIPSGLTVEGDANLIEVLLENLLGNAWKFTRTRAEAKIEVGRATNAKCGSAFAGPSASATATADETADQPSPGGYGLASKTRNAELPDDAPVYFVRDNGVGFDMAYADKLFDAFQRLHSASDFEGTGIGLATVQRIARRHGGQVWAEGAVDKGATVYFTLGH